MTVRRRRALVAASVAGLLAAAGSAWWSKLAQAQDDDVESAHCYGINKCQGTGDCGGKTHSCHGQNACKGQGYIDLNKEDCLRINGGRLTEAPETK